MRAMSVERLSMDSMPALRAGAAASLSSSREARLRRSEIQPPRLPPARALAESQLEHASGDLVRAGTAFVCFGAG